MRHIIDYEPQEEFTELRKAIESEGDHELAELLVDYLNFFEFVASLWKLRQLSLKEIAMVFEYYILRLDDYKFISDFIANQGFENLHLLIQQLKRSKRKPK